VAGLAYRLDRAMIGAVATPNPPLAPAALPSLMGRRRLRALPHPDEHARRVAWGRKYGPLVGQGIRAAIREAE
jgi:hypothetical protein